MNAPSCLVLKHPASCRRQLLHLLHLHCILFLLLVRCVSFASCFFLFSFAFFLLCFCCLNARHYISHGVRKRTNASRTFRVNGRAGGWASERDERALPCCVRTRLLVLEREKEGNRLSESILQCCARPTDRPPQQREPPHRLYYYYQMLSCRCAVMLKLKLQRRKRRRRRWCAWRAFLVFYFAIFFCSFSKINKLKWNGMLMLSLT